MKRLLPLFALSIKRIITAKKRIKKISMFIRLGLSQLLDKSSRAKDREKSIKRKQRDRNRILTKEPYFKFVMDGEDFII